MRNRPTETQLLSVVRKLQPNAYGLSVYDELCSMGFNPSLGSIYIAMEQLERDGKVKSHHGDPAPERGNRPKRFWEITE